MIGEHAATPIGPVQPRGDRGRCSSSARSCRTDALPSPACRRTLAERCPQRRRLGAWRATTKTRRHKAFFGALVPWWLPRVGTRARNRDARLQRRAAWVNIGRGPLRRGSQVVRQGSAKAPFVGSIPTLASSFFPAPPGCSTDAPTAGQKLLVVAEAGWQKTGRAGCSGGSRCLGSSIGRAVDS